MKRPIYLDHNATTPLDPDVLDAMLPYFTEQFGNPSSAEHFYGHEASEAVEAAREGVAHFINAQADEIVFTGSCTEANNLAIQGVFAAQPDKRHFVTSQIEHPSVLETFRHLETLGATVTYVGVGENGLVDPDEVQRAIDRDTALVSIMAANNEVGTVQPIYEIGRICGDKDVLFHSDLAQGAHLPIDVTAANVHIASLSAHKAYGPKGVGALYVRSRRPRARLQPLLFGGGQERNLRPGTVNTPLVVGMAAALSKIRHSRQSETKRLAQLRDSLTDMILHSVEGTQVNGDRVSRIPNNSSFSIQNVEPLALIRHLRREVAFSAVSACSTGKVETSHVLLSMFGDTRRARGAFRLAVGRFTTDDDIKAASELIAATVRTLRRIAFAVERT